MRTIDRRAGKLETASRAKSKVCVMQIGDQTFESAIDSWMTSNPGKGDPRYWAEITVLHVELA